MRFIQAIVISKALMGESDGEKWADSVISVCVCVCVCFYISPDLTLALTVCSFSEKFLI